MRGSCQSYAVEIARKSKANGVQDLSCSAAADDSYPELESNAGIMDLSIWVSCGAEYSVDIGRAHPQSVPLHIAE
jgi:hypothetical protein